MKASSPLPDSAFVVLALLAEGEAYGYDIQKVAHNRGFQFWTKLKRSSIYNALSSLEADGLVISKVRRGEGPDRKVFAITTDGKARLRAEATRHLAAPTHPKSEIDLGIYALPFLGKEKARRALEQSIAHLEIRREFLAERLNWCQSKNLGLPALAFERPMRLLDAEIEWLRSVVSSHETGAFQQSGEWKDYEFKQPPNASNLSTGKSAEDHA